MTNPHTFLDHLLRRFHPRRPLVSRVADGVERATWWMRGAVRRVHEAIGVVVEAHAEREWEERTRRESAARGECWFCAGLGTYFECPQSRQAVTCEACGGTGRAERGERRRA